MNTAKSFKKFIIHVTLLTVLLGVLAISLQYLFPGISLPDLTVYIFLFFYLVTNLVHFGLLKASEKRAVLFVRYFMVLTVLKLFLYLIFVMLLIFFNRDEAVHIAVSFFVLYLFYTSYEIIAILNHLKTSNPSDEPTKTPVK